MGRSAGMIVHNLLVSLAETVSGITPLIPYYHTVSDERLAHIRHLHPYKNERQFSADVDYLGRRYQPVSLNDLLDCVKRGRELRKGSFILTFDDGYSQAHSVIAPLLYRKGIPAIFFLTADFIDNRGLSQRNKASIIVDRLLRDGGDRIAPSAAVLTRLDATPGELPKRILALRNREADVLDEIALSLGVDFEEYLSQEQPYLTSHEIRKLLGMGFFIGAHSFEHPLYQDLPIDEQVRETTGSVQYIREKFGLEYSLFAFPHSDLFIRREFFRRIEGAVDLTFGTSGIHKDPIATNLQRINFERALRGAADLVARQLFKKILWGRTKNMVIERDFAPEAGGTS